MVSPVTSDSESQQFFKPQNRTATSLVGKKTDIAGFQVFGGSIKGVVEGLKTGLNVEQAVIAIDGVNTTQSDIQGVYYVNFNTFPSKHKIEAIHSQFIFDPIEVTVTDETRQLPLIQATATYVCGYVFMINYEKDIYERSLKPRTVRCLQEPNPLD